MNTKQTIVLCYAVGLVVVSLWVFSELNSINPVVATLVSILLVAGVLLYVFKSGSNVDRTKLRRAVGIPVIALTGVVALLVAIDYWFYSPRSIDSPDVEIVDPVFRIERSGYQRDAVLSGWVKDNLDVTIRELEFKIEIYKVAPDTVSEGGELILLSVGDEGKIDDIPASRVLNDGAPIDAETINWTNYSGIPPSESRSFEATGRYTSLEMPDNWAWSFSVVSGKIIRK